MSSRNPIIELYELKQSIWYDNINRGLLVNGDIARMIRDGDIQGMTSNPTIFEKAIAKSNNYDAAFLPLVEAKLGPEEIFYSLAIEDIQNAADLFEPIYEKTRKHDGYVSLEVSPYIANDTLKTIQEAKRLWGLENRPNVMIKIPATLEGVEAVRRTIADGINVNVTLIFSNDRYQKVIEAFLAGIEDRLNAGLPVDSIASVASFFISRVDVKVEKKLNEIIAAGTPYSKNALSLMGKVAIANCQLAYFTYLDYFNSPRWLTLKEKGACEQRPLWASTGTKNPAYSDVLYIESLIFPNTVNTVPHETLIAFKDHGKPSLSELDKEKSQEVLSRLKEIHIDMETITTELELEGVKSFSDSFTSLLNTIKEKK